MTDNGGNVKNKFNVLIFLPFTAFFLFVGWHPVKESYVPEVKKEIQNSMINAIKAYEEFPKTLDSHGFLMYFAADFSGVMDGENVTLKDVDRSLDYMAEQIKRGEVGGISFKISDLNIYTISADLGWLTYQDERKFADVRKSEVRIHHMKSKCTALVRKEKGSWLIYHEHCSTHKG